MLDTVDGGRISALADDDHAAFHVDGGQPRVAPYNHHHWHVDCREDVDVHQEEGQRAEDQHQQRHNGD
jgi:hypothetical protein